ncbi:MAG TPA: high-potential iron-sulfur protein [Bdellovibrionota bacterium]|jgi:hypothetical protein
MRRRSFLKTTLLSLATLPLLGRWNALAAEAELPMAKEGEEPAKSLKFCTSADKPNKGCDARKSKDKAKQYCYNCQLFTRLEGEKKAGKGKCMIMPKNRVPAGGWCMSWVQNPAVKD